MKNLFYSVAIFLFLASCSSTSQMASTGSNPSGTVVGMNAKKQQEQQQQIERKADWTTPIPSNAGMGPGPVNVAASNFYFEGNFQLMDNIPTFYDCAAGVNLPIATDMGIYSEVASQYKGATTKAGEILRAAFRGYLVDTPGAPYPKKLVITYVVSWSKESSLCDAAKELTGKWSAQLAAAYNGNVVLTLANDFSFNAMITSSKGNMEVKGAWMMTSKTDLVFIYTSMCPYMGHSGSYNPKNMTMFIPTSTGTLILKK